MERLTVYVLLLDERTDIWRPVAAVEVKSGAFEIAADALMPGDERWEFGPGERVICRADADGLLIATSRSGA